MGVKSTINLTRQEAIKKFADLKLADQKVRRQFEAEATVMSDSELETELEKLNDREHGGEGFENYNITAHSRWDSCGCK